MDRREFLTRAGATFAAAAAAPSLLAASRRTAEAEPITGDKRGYVAGKFAVELDGMLAGWVQSAEGGLATSDVVVEKLGPDHIARKHIAGVKYGEMIVDVGTGMSKIFYEWIKSMFSHQDVRRSGAITGATYDYKETSRLEFRNAVLTGVMLPGLDAASKDAATMTVSWVPEFTQMRRSGGSAVSRHAGADKSGLVQKRWLACNFRLKIDGLDCTRVNKIEPLLVQQKVVENAVGDMRDYQKEPAYLQIPNLVITLPESQAEPFYQWHEDFVIKGNNGDARERSGTLEYLTPNLQEVLYTVTFSHLGIFKIGPEKVESGSETIRRVKVEMYCEDMEFDYKASWA